MTLSRTTVLSLSGWSNTQFAYWARRAEGISVLSPFDGRLRLVAAVLQRQLIQAGVSSLLTESSQEKSDGTNPPSPKTTPPGVINFAMSQHELPDEVDGDPEKWVKTSVTGKGLDVMIDEVKKRCGVSPFLRGKHSSLDPFGAVVTDRDADGNITHREAPTIYMPTFQAEMYVHEISASVSSSAGIMATENLGKRKASPEVSQPSPEPQRSVPIPIPPPHPTSMTWPSLPSERHIENLEIHIDATPPPSHAQPPVIHTPSPSLMYPPDIFDTMGSMGIRTEHPSVIPSGPWNIDNFPLSHSRSQPGDVTMRSRSSSYSDRMPKKRKYSAPPVGVDSSAFGGYYQDLSSLSMSWDVHQMQGG